MKIGLFGGSFNPIHNGHISLARQLLQQAGLDEVWLVVSPQNPLKRNATELLDDQLRYAMVRVALHGEKGLLASDCELHLPKPSYTWNTLEHLKADFPDNEFVLLIGGDNWASFHRWYRADEILKNHRIVVYPRRDSMIDRTQLPANVTVVDAELLDVSSTMIRQQVKEQQDISAYVPKTIIPLVRRCYN